MIQYTKEKTYSDKLKTILEEKSIMRRIKLIMVSVVIKGEKR